MNSLNTSSWHNNAPRPPPHHNDLKPLQMYNKGKMMKCACRVEKYAAIKNTNYGDSKMFMVC